MDGYQRSLDMIELKPPHRAATKNDAAALAKLVNYAGEGMPLYLWSKMAQPGESPWDIGRQRAARESGSFCYRNATVTEVDGAVVAALIGYALADAPEPADYDDMPPMFVPLQQLEDLAPATWYVNVLATDPEHRSQGHGAALLSIAERLAVETGRRGLSLIVSDANVGARRLYERMGYREIAARPMVKDDWQNDGENWLLLVRELSAD